jgi:hypothetical protein
VMRPPASFRDVLTPLHTCGVRNGLRLAEPTSEAVDGLKCPAFAQKAARGSTNPARRSPHFVVAHLDELATVEMCPVIAAASVPPIPGS